MKMTIMTFALMAIAMMTYAQTDTSRPDRNIDMYQQKDTSRIKTDTAKKDRKGKTGTQKDMQRDTSRRDRYDMKK